MHESPPRECDAARRNGVGQLAEKNNEGPMQTMVRGVGDGGFPRPDGGNDHAVLHKGDKLQFECHVDTTAAQARKLGVPEPTTNLHFANQAFGAEMCILYLETTGPALISATPLL